MIISTMDLRNYLIMLNKLLIIKIYEGCVRRKINIGKLYGILIYVELVFLDRLLMSRRNFNRVVGGMRLLILRLDRWKLMGYHFWS